MWVGVHTSDSLPTFSAVFDGPLPLEWTSTDSTACERWVPGRISALEWTSTDSTACDGCLGRRGTCCDRPRPCRRALVRLHQRHPHLLRAHRLGRPAGKVPPHLRACCEADIMARHLWPGSTPNQDLMSCMLPSHYFHSIGGEGTGFRNNRLRNFSLRNFSQWSKIPPSLQDSSLPRPILRYFFQVFLRCH